MHIPSISNQQATVSSGTTHKNEALQSDLPKEVEVQPFLLDKGACDEFQTQSSQKPITDRKSKIHSIINSKRRDQAVLIQSGTRNDESIHLLRTIEFLGLRFVFIPCHLSERVATKKSIIPGHVDKWLELLYYPNGKEEDVIECFRKADFEVVSTDEIIKKDYHKQKKSKPTLLITGIKEKEKSLVKNRLFYYKDTIAINRLSLNDEIDTSNSEILSIYQDYPRTERLPSAFRKSKKIRQTPPEESHPSHDHPPRSNSNIVFVLDNVDNPVNIQGILLFACDRGMEELHYIPKNIDKRKVLQDLYEQLQCPVNIRYFDSIEPSIASLKQRGFTIYASELDPEAITLDRVKPVEKKAIIVGNEAHGISPESRELSDIKVMIPGKGCAQSLNVSAATAILADGLDPEIAKR